MSQPQRRLIILSVPFQRLTRVLLGEPVLKSVRREGDVVIVSPFATNPTFQSEFAADGTRFVAWKLPETLGRTLRYLLALSEMLRVQGYWRRLRHRGMGYYFANQNLMMGNDGQDKRLPFLRRVLMSCVSVLGSCPKAWRGIDRLIGPRAFDTPAIREMAAAYDHVTLIQSASWGYQDRMLAWMGRRYDWHTVMVPYTSDQLFCNGYLISDFDTVCVQGPAEHGFAEEFHEVPPSRIVRLGSAWYRYMECFATATGAASSSGRQGERRTILFAGVSRTYFPYVSEQEALTSLVRAVEEGRLGNVGIVYRPVPVDAETRQAIEAAWGNHQHVQLQWPHAASLGLDAYGEGRTDVAVREYTAQLQEAAVVVMSLTTSLSIDAAFHGVPSISVFADASGTLDRRGTYRLLNAQGHQVSFASVPIVHAVDDIVPLVRQILDSTERANDLAQWLAVDWDYPKTDFEGTLRAVIRGDPPRVGEQQYTEVIHSECAYQ